MLQPFEGAFRQNALDDAAVKQRQFVIEPVGVLQVVQTGLQVHLDGLGGQALEQGNLFELRQVPGHAREAGVVFADGAVGRPPVEQVLRILQLGLLLNADEDFERVQAVEVGRHQPKVVLDGALAEADKYHCLIY